MKKTLDPGYQDQLDLQKYAKRRRQEINDFIAKMNPAFMTLFEAEKALRSKDPHYENKIHAILDPLIVASLSYDPIRKVTKIQKIGLKRKQWLIDYWLTKYEIDISPEGDFGDWEYQVGLLFENWWFDYHYQEYYPASQVYDYPSCLIATFLVPKKEE